MSANLPIIDGIDVFDPLLVGDTESRLRQVGSNPQTVAGMCNGVDLAVAQIIAISPRNALLLRFHGHDNVDVVYISFGEADLDRAWDERPISMRTH